MRTTKTFAISLPPDLAASIEQRARLEHRTRSELLREAFRQYELRQERWEQMTALGREAARREGLDTEVLVNAFSVRAVRAVRGRRRRR